MIIFCFVFITSEDSIFTTYAIDKGLIPILINKLGFEVEETLKNTIQCIGNIAAQNIANRQTLLEEGLLEVYAEARDDWKYDWHITTNCIFMMTEMLTDFPDFVNGKLSLILRDLKAHLVINENDKDNIDEEDPDKSQKLLNYEKVKTDTLEFLVEISRVHSDHSHLMIMEFSQFLNNNLKQKDEKNLVNVIEILTNLTEAVQGEKCRFVDMDFMDA